MATYSNSKGLNKARVSISISQELLEAIDLLRGVIPRSFLIEAILRWAISQTSTAEIRITAIVRREGEGSIAEALWSSSLRLKGF